MDAKKFFFSLSLTGVGESLCDWTVVESSLDFLVCKIIILTK